MYEFGDILNIKPGISGTSMQKVHWGMVYEDVNELSVLLAIEDHHDGDSIATIFKDDMEWGELPQNGLKVTGTIVPIDRTYIQEKTGHVGKSKIDEILRNIMLRIVEKHYLAVHADKEEFTPGATPIVYAGRVYDAEEMKSLVDASMDFWLTTGKNAAFFSKELARLLGTRYCMLTNSGSSANLLAISALTSPKLGEKQCRPGDEVITTACAFPTTVNPIVQNNMVPVFVDVEPGSYNIKSADIEKAISDRTRAIFVAHTLGNPFDIEQVMALADEYNLWVIEDNCDALGSKYREKYTGTFGDIATLSFYPAHHITTGEGGAVITSDRHFKRIVESFRDWGRDCWCEPGHDNTCGRRFDWQLGTLPKGYDHKYIYSHVGYNLKMTEMQAAIGTAQIKKLPDFIQARKRNWERLRMGMEEHKSYFILPEATPHSDPSWFGFLITVRNEAPFSRWEIVEHLDEKHIATRMLFAGNLVRQPSFEGVNYRVSGDLRNTEQAMNYAFWLGVYPGLGDKEINYIIDTIDEFINKTH